MRKEFVPGDTVCVREIIDLEHVPTGVGLEARVVERVIRPRLTGKVLLFAPVLKEVEVLLDEPWDGALRHWFPAGDMWLCLRATHGLSLARGKRSMRI